MAYLLFSKWSHYVHQVTNFLNKGYCETLDQTTYLRERAAFYAKVKNEIYHCHLLANQQKEQQLREKRE